MIMDKVEQVLDKFGYNTIISGGLEGTHGPRSAHYRNMALDFRTHHISKQAQEGVYLALCEAFGADPTSGLGTTYDVLWEAKGTPHDHWHIEVNMRVVE